MAKALYGHLAADPVMLAEVSRLRRRVRELEDDLASLRADNAELAARVAPDRAPAAVGAGAEALIVDDLLTLEARQEPALT